jgi:serine/threonine protein kinase
MDVLATNTRLANRFVIANSLSVGGMGAVYLAFDSAHSQPCVVKEMLDQYKDPGERAKVIQDFNREADMLANLHHSNIPKILTRFTENDRHYLVMEYVQGSNLEQLLEKRGTPCSEDEVVGWMNQVLDLLGYLHMHKPPIIYRDLKPANLMLRHDGRVMMIDFGIARFFSPMARGTMIGTPGYAPPEQYQGLAEPRSDLFALGATMFHLLTGRDPRDPRNLLAPWMFPAITAINLTLTPGLAQVVSKSLALDLDARYASAKAMLADLQNYRNLQPRGIGTQVVTPTSAPSVPQPSSGSLAPVLAVDVKSIDFGTVNASSPAQVKSFTITNPIAATHGNVVLRGSIDANQPWITLDTSSFSISTQRATVKVTVDPKTLPSGSHSGAVIITSNSGTETIVVLVNVVGPVLSVSPKQINLGQITLGQTRQAAFFVTNANARGGGLSGTIQSDQPWANPVVSTFQTRDRQAVQVHVDTDGLTAGRQRAIITIRTNGGTEQIEIALQVIAPSLSYGPLFLDFGDLMRNQKKILLFKVSNKGAGILEGTLKPSQPWIRTDKKDFRISSTTTVSVQVMVEALNLDRGREYREAVTIYSNGGTESVTIRFFVVPYTIGESMIVALANQGVEFR